MLARLLPTCATFCKGLCSAQLRLTASARLHGHLRHHLLALLADWPCFLTAVNASAYQEALILVTLLTPNSSLNYHILMNGRGNHGLSPLRPSPL